MSDTPPRRDPRPPSPSTSPPDRRESPAETTEREPVRPPPMLTLLAFLVGLGLIIAFVVIRYVLPGYADY